MKPRAKDESGNRDLAARAGVADPACCEVLDLEGLQRRCMGNLDLVERVIEKFQQRLPEELASLEKAMETGEPEEIARAAHRIKGTSASVSANRLQAVAEAIEELSRAAQTAEIPAHFALLKGEWARYQRHRESLPSSVASLPKELMP
jgi:HPt (histidine-containing phosphotransfer) domain-containing protein